MKVKNIGTNPVHGIKPGEVGELPKNRESRLKQYVKYGMLEVVGETTEDPKTEEVTDANVVETTEEPKRQTRGRKKAEDN